jgi:hypothetical protein
MGANMKRSFSIATTFTILVLLAFPLPSTAEDKIKGLTAKKPRLNRLVLSGSPDLLQGVPASPVDSFVWDGVGSIAIKGEVTKYAIDPESNTGKIVAEWKDENGKWKWKQTVFAPPGHPTGLRMAQDASISSGGPKFHWPPPFNAPPPPFSAPPYVLGDPITTDIYLHGNTFAGGPVLPTVFNIAATWGPCEIKLDGKPFLNPFDGPAPNWVCHTMLTRGVRHSDGTVRSNSPGGPGGPSGSACAGNTIFAPSRSWPFIGPTGEENGCEDFDDLEFHMVFHDAPTIPATDGGKGNYPQAFDFFYHIVFEKVKEFTVKEKN